VVRLLAVLIVMAARGIGVSVKRPVIAWSEVVMVTGGER
jgi:hypothetical protein